MENTMPTWEEVKALIPEKVHLHCTDRGDNLDSYTAVLQKCISKGNLQSLYNVIDDALLEDTYSEDEYVKDLKDNVESTFDIEADELMDEYNDSIREVLMERDDSNVIKDLVRNTSDMVLFYDTGHCVECSYPMSEEECEEQLKEIKDLINLNTSDYDELIKQMMYNASYGGNLVVYFTGSVYDIVKNIEDSKPNVIRFGGEVHIAIPNHGCGAGDHTSFKHSFELPFSNSNLFICKEVKYSYTYEVCGMSSNWCSKTNMELVRVEEPIGEVLKSSTTSHMEREAELNKIFKEGGCTYGDQNYSRHRDVKYYNEPMYCRNECPHCHTVWID